MTDNGWIAAGQKHLWHPFTQHAVAPAPLPVVGAKGVYLELADGRRVLDAIGSWWTSVHGHGHPAIAAAIARQARSLDHVLLAGCVHPPAAELAERLVAHAPVGLERVFYSDDGSTAVEVALKMALQYWSNQGRAEKRGFVALANGYHGDTVGGLSAGDPETFQHPFGPLLFPVDRLVPPYQAGGRSVEAALAEATELFERRAEGLAALIVEPLVQGASGMRMYPASYLRGLRALCDRHDLLLIADEVMTGFGRTGHMFATGLAGVTPDLLCLSKALSGGALPLSATVATGAIFDAFHDQDIRRAFLHGHSFTGNPIACAAALAGLDLFESEGLLERVATIEQFYADRLPAIAGHPRVAQVRWLGAIGVVELAGDSDYFAATGPALRDHFLARDVLVRPLGPVLYTLPPYVIKTAELSRVYDVLEEFLDA